MTAATAAFLLSIVLFAGSTLLWMIAWRLRFEEISLWMFWNATVFQAGGIICLVVWRVTSG